MSPTKTKSTDGSTIKARKGLRLTTRNTLLGYSFIMPNLIGFIIFTFIPVCFSLALSFVEWDGFTAMKFVGLQNFISIFKDTYFRQALARTLLYTVGTVVPTTFISLGLAVLMNKKLKGISLFRSAVFFPYVASIVAVGAVWKMLFMKDFGPINEFLRLIGIANPPGWFSSSKWALVGVVVVSIWKNMGYFMIVYLAAMQGIPEDLREASALDGASSFKHFWKVVFPMLAPSTFFVVLMLTINSFKAFDLIYVLTEGGPGQSSTLLVNYIYKTGFANNKYGVASAAAMVLLVIVGIITFVQFRVEKKINE